MSNLVWIINGHVVDAQAESFYKANRRIVHLVCPEFPTTEQATEALLQGWSRTPHKARVESINPLIVKGVHSEREHLHVTILEGGRA